MATRITPNKLDDDEVKYLLRHSLFGSEAEDERSWSQSCRDHFRVPLLRISDAKAGYYIDANGSINARARFMSLGSKLARTTSLETHIDHQKWIATPYISFTSSRKELQELAEQRARIGRRTKQVLTVINPNTRIRHELPIRDLGEEMRFYGIENPYGDDKYLEDHYICLWQVTEDEIVGHWDWDQLAEYGNWYGDIIVPAFREHERRQAIEIQSLMDNLTCKSNASQSI